MTEPVRTPSDLDVVHGGTRSCPQFYAGDSRRGYGCASRTKVPLLPIWKSELSRRWHAWWRVGSHAKLSTCGRLPQLCGRLARAIIERTAIDEDIVFVETGTRVDSHVGGPHRELFVRNHFSRARRHRVECNDLNFAVNGSQFVRDWIYNGRSRIPLEGIVGLAGNFLKIRTGR